MKPCPSDDTLADFIEGRLIGTELAAFYEHTSGCSTCAATLAALVESPATAADLPDARESEHSPLEAQSIKRDEPPRTDLLNPNEHIDFGGDETGDASMQAALGAEQRITDVAEQIHPMASPRPEIAGRYRPIEVLGAGGMGIVYLARDTQLNRNVALKVTRAGMSRSDVLRMFREAQAMAQLSHRNVVAVHDVGMSHDHVFVAMEYLEGGTLARYLLEQAPDWRQILQRFLEAGLGLAAAHRCGIVHRDFKPENVLLSATGEARVGDFGLAHWADHVDQLSLPSSESHRSRMSTEAARRARLTRAGTLVGTPAYMAPEQIRGGAVDHRADIWSFCAALYEALYCELPFSGRTLEEVNRYIDLGCVRAPSHGSKVPRWLRKVLVRGLRAEPEARFATMEALLDELRTRRRLGPMSVLGAVALAAFLGLCGVYLWGMAPRRSLVRSEVDRAPQSLASVPTGPLSSSSIRQVDADGALRAVALVGDANTTEGRSDARCEPSATASAAASTVAPARPPFDSGRLRPSTQSNGRRKTFPKRPAKDEPSPQPNEQAKLPVEKPSSNEGAPLIQD